MVSVGASLTLAARAANCTSEVAHLEFAVIDAEPAAIDLQLRDTALDRDWWRAYKQRTVPGLSESAVETVRLWSWSHHISSVRTSQIRLK